MKTLEQLGISPTPWKKADDGMGYKDIYHSLLEGSCNVCLIIFLSLHIKIIQVIEHRRLKSGE